MKNMSKRELVLKVLRNEEAERIPVGFWFHFLPDPRADGMKDPRLTADNLAGHRKFYRDFQPDMVKIMSDGFFIYPNEVFLKARSASELREMRPLGEHHPWIEKQVAMVRELTGFFGAEVVSFYNIFAPATNFKFARPDAGQGADTVLADFIAGDREAVKYALGVAAGDLALLARRVISEGGADGIYLSTQDVNDPRIDAELHRAVIRPGDVTVLEEANRAGQLNILHICGYSGHRNDLSHFADYPAQIFNWAAVVEGVPLGEGKKIFRGRPVIGGFDNTGGGILYRGSREEIERETGRLITEAGKTGVILGADCTVPSDIDLRRLGWVRDRAAALS